MKEEYNLETELNEIYEKHQIFEEQNK